MSRMTGALAACGTAEMILSDRMIMLTDMVTARCGTSYTPPNQPSRTCWARQRSARPTSR
jgi:hypothetical protein